MKTASKILLTVLSLGSQMELASVKLTFVGDVMVADGPGKIIERGEDPFQAVASVLTASDYTIGNLECPVSTKGTALEQKPVTFLAHPRVVPVLKKYFYGMALSNNHSGDYGTPAFDETMSLLKAAGIKYFGGGKNLKDAHEPLWILHQGQKIALLGYNEFKPRSFEAGPSKSGIAWSEDSQVLADIALARKNGADLVIPFMHWGWESETQPSQRQVDFAHLMIDHGADMVIGGHPHVTQGVDEYKGKPIIWSLGNFVFDGFDEGPGRWGWILQIETSKKQVEKYKITPVHLNAEGAPAFESDSVHKVIEWSFKR